MKSNYYWKKNKLNDFKSSRKYERIQRKAGKYNWYENHFFLPILSRRSNAREFSVGKSFFLFFAELKKWVEKNIECNKNWWNKLRKK